MVKNIILKSMKNKRQSAVEWLVEQLEEHHVKIDIKNTIVFQQAKEKEKEQIIDANNIGYSSGKRDTDETAEQYYTSTYGK